jgi:hypothetical protein
MVDFTKKQVERSIDKFRDYSRDLMEANYNNFDNELQIWLNHCKNDEVMKAVVQNLENEEIYQKADLIFLTPLGGMIGSSHINLPTDEYERDVFIYNKLRNVGCQKVVNIMMKCRGKDNLDGYIREFSSLFVTKLIRSLIYKIEEMLERVESEVPEGQKISERLLIIFQDNSVTIGEKATIGGNAAIGNEASVKNELS